MNRIPSLLTASGPPSPKIAFRSDSHSGSGRAATGAAFDFAVCSFQRAFKLSEERRVPLDHFAHARRRAREHNLGDQRVNGRGLRVFGRRTARDEARRPWR